MTRNLHCAGHRAPKRICMLAYAFYENDNRITRYAEALARRGDTVDVLALRRDGMPRRERMSGVNVYRIQMRRRDERGRLRYLLRLLRFWVTSSTILAAKHLRSPYDVIHVHSVPDFEVFAAWLPKCMGAKVILDIHDLVPEFYASKFGGRTDALCFKALVWLERVSARFADHVIAANDIWRGKLTSRSISDARCTAFLNYVDPNLFYRRTRTRTDDKFIFVYPGGLQWHQGVDIAVRAFARITERVPNAEFHIYGEGPESAKIEALVAELGLQSRVMLKGARPLREIPEVISNADAGVVPKRADSFGNEAYSTKILEYMSQGVPVLVSRTSIDTFYFSDRTVRFFESGNEHELAEAMVELAVTPALRRAFSDAGLAYVARNNWSLKQQEYFDLVDSLVAGIPLARQTASGPASGRDSRPAALNPCLPSGSIG